MIYTLVVIAAVTAIATIFAICPTIVFPIFYHLAEGLLALVFISRYKL